ncbi:MAG: hypothetical protein HY736_20855 [Verrucomicrobia bacterium]|nr:hypothetical protein [Verrucomicrobiota bacterium]
MQRYSFLMGVIVLASIDVAAGAEKQVVTVFLLAGQSNLAGRAPGEELPVAYRTPPSAVRVDYVCSFGAAETGVGAPEPHVSAGWVPLQPAPKHASTPGEHFGPEIGFGHAIASARPGERVVLIKHGRGATSLAADWKPDATAGPRLFAEFMTQVRRALDRLAAEGAEVRLGAFIWCQGEADSTRADWAIGYERNLEMLIARVRRDLAAPLLPAIIVLTGDGAKNPRMTDAARVRQAQRSVVNAGELRALVTADELSLFDSVHYDAASQLRLGEKIARTYVRLEKLR